MIDICANKHGGNAASQDAYTQGAERHASQRVRILDLIRATNGITSKQISRHLDIPLNAMSGRLTELKAAGLIRGTGVRLNGAEILEAV